MTKAELKSKAKAAGSHYFDRDTMRFFNSKLISVYEGPNGVYFVTYERGPHGAGSYSVRHFSGKSINTVGDFMGHTKPDAQQKAKALAGSGRAGVKRSKAHRSAPKRSKTARGTKRRRAVRRLHRLRRVVRKRGWGVMRHGARGNFHRVSTASYHDVHDFCPGCRRYFRIQMDRWPEHTLHGHPVGYPLNSGEIEAKCSLSGKRYEG